MATVWDNLEKGGTIIGGWNYDEVGINYDSLLDPDTNNTVYYNGVGLDSVWTNSSPKATSTFSKPTKTSSTWTNTIKI